MIADFDERIKRADLELFKYIHSESTPGDRRSWLALQRLARERKQSYVYLEIGSHLGGSIQPHLQDRRCRRIYSIDKRPVQPPDDRGIHLRYEDNSTARMLDMLRAVDAGEIEKIVCFDLDAREISISNILEPPDLCFIDGEHTKAAVLSDFRFCMRVSARNAIIFFHDDRIIAPAVSDILRGLESLRFDFTALKLHGSTFAILLGQESISNHVLCGIASDGRKAVRRLTTRLALKKFVPRPLGPAASRLFGYKD